MSLPSFIDFDSSWGVSRRAILFDCVWQAVGVGWRAAGGYPHRFSHNNFSSLYRIFTKLGHDSPVKGKQSYLLWVPVGHAHSILPWLPVPFVTTSGDVTFCCACSRDHFR
jgi:hypothetical protein